MPDKHREQGYRLGSWVGVQRTTKDTMLPDRRERLDALGFVWDVLTAQWEEGFRCLAIFRQREGHCHVPISHREQGYRLGSWVGVQRQNHDTILSERRERLEALGFVWDVLTAQWEEGFRFLAIFRQRGGHCRVPQLHREQDFRLGQWVGVQRTTKDAMSPDRRQRLDALGFVWDILTAKWEEGFRFLERYRQREGHCRVPRGYRDPVSGYRLEQWVGDQRAAQDKLSPDRRQRLDALGFVWDVLTAKWEEGFRFLERYRQDKGDCLVPATYRDPASGYRLGSWVSNQRQDKDTMSPERRQRLDMLGFVWDPLAAQWEEGFRFLAIFRQREGHCLVPQLHREQGFQLGTWVANQRGDQDTMSPDRRQRLDALGFGWEVLTAKWEEGFHFLASFRQREGHCRVPQLHREQGFRLGQWVGVQRTTKDAMSPDRRQRLDALGFVWNTLAASWEEGFRSLEIFRQREGHCRVPINHREQGYRLGGWVDAQRQNKDTMLPERRQRLDALGFVGKVR